MVDEATPGTSNWHGSGGGMGDADDPKQGPVWKQRRRRRGTGVGNFGFFGDA
jgi:hypothetical protein